MTAPIYFHETDLFPYRPISRIWMIIYVSLSFALFTKLNRIFVVKSNWLQQNTLLSFIHSSISSIFVIISVIRAPEMFEDPLSHSNHFNYAALAFTLGYFLYDFVDCIKNATAKIYPILFHHILAIGFLFYVLYYTRIMGYAIYGLSMEINSIFLHARRFLRLYPPLFKSNDDNNLLKLFVDIGNYITVILLRFGIVIICLRDAYIIRHRFNPVAYTFTVLATVSVGVLNVVLFYRLVKNQLREKSKTKREKPVEDKILID